MTRKDIRANSPKSVAQAEAQKKWSDRLEAKLKKIESNKEAREKRTPQQQLALLDERLGKGVGAVKERRRLQKLIDEGCND